LRQFFVALGQKFFLGSRKFFDTGFHAQGVFLIGEFELPEDFLWRERLGEFGSMPCAVFLETSRNIYGVTRVDAVSGTAQHVDKVWHTLNI
jgi:hypothetical protein